MLQRLQTQFLNGFHSLETHMARLSEEVTTLRVESNIHVRVSHYTYCIFGFYKANSVSTAGPAPRPSSPAPSEPKEGETVRDKGMETRMQSELK